MTQDFAPRHKLLSLIAAAVVLTALLTGSAWAAPAGQTGKPLLNGLRSDIVSLSRPAPDVLIAGYRLQWVGPGNGWSLSRAEPINFVFWTAAKQRVFGGFDIAEITPAFQASTIKTMNVQIGSRIPPGATAVSLSLGTSGLETAARPLPKH